MIRSLMTKTISVFSKKQHHKSTRGKQQGENSCLPIQCSWTISKLQQTFYLQFPNIKFFNIFIFKLFFLKKILPKRVSSLMNILLARRRKSEVHPGLREKYPFDCSRTPNLGLEGMRSSTLSHEC